LLAKFAILPRDYNDTEKTIYFTPGVCSLEDLLKKPNFTFTPDQAVHIFATLLEFILLLSEKDYCHSDLKPANT
jgi:serine/threonine protein kinase